jgi:protein involved in polysaccharide export with SLBB domain
MNTLLPIANEIGRAVLHSVWEGAAISLLFAVVMVLLRNRAASSRYLVACATLGLMVILPIATIVLTPRPQNDFASRAAVSVQNVPAAPIIQGEATAPALVQYRVKLSLLQYVAAAWAVGFGVVSIWQFSGWFAVRSLVRRATPTDDGLRAHFDQLRLRVGIRFPISLRLSESVTTPALIGWLRPVILIPSAALCELPADYLESLLLHELAHVRRHDYLVNLLQTIAETLLFYHPVAWWVSRIIRTERENCCDDQTVRHADRKVYVKALAMMELVRSSGIGRLALTASGGTLLPRIQRLTRTAPSRGRSGAGFIAMLALLATIVVLTACYAAESHSKDKTNPTSQPSALVGGQTRGVLPDDLIEPEYTGYRIQPGDRLSITVWNFEAPSKPTMRTTVVSEAGQVNLLMIKNPISVNGLTEMEAEKAVIKVYRDAPLIESPMVSVNVIEPHASSFAIVGAVNHAGQFSIPDPKFHLLNAIAVAGGTVGEVRRIVILRAPARSGATTAIEIPADKLLAGDPSYNVSIRPHDTVVVGALSAGSLTTQTPQAQAAAQPPKEPGGLASTDFMPMSSFAIWPDDRVSFQIGMKDRTEIVKQSRVSSAGEVSLPRLKNPLKLTGMTDDEVTAAIENSYRQAGVTDFQSVDFSVVERRALTFFVFVGGHVNRPGSLQVKKDARLLEAVSLTDGITTDSSSKILLKRQWPSGTPLRQFKLNKDKILAGDDASNLYLRPGDQILFGVQ